MSKHTNSTANPEPEASQADKRLAELETQVASLTTQLQEAQNAKLLARADLDNYRKQMEAEKAKFGAIANMQLVLSIFEIVDDILLANQDPELDLTRAKEMLGIVNDKLSTSLQIAGLEKVAVNIGDKFDSSTMEAVTTIPVEAADKDQTVVSVISSAYRYRGLAEVLRHAKVVVGKHNPTNGRS